MPLWYHDFFWNCLSNTRKRPSKLNRHLTPYNALDSAVPTTARSFYPHDSLPAPNLCYAFSGRLISFRGQYILLIFKHANFGEYWLSCRVD